MRTCFITRRYLRLCTLSAVVLVAFSLLYHRLQQDSFLKAESLAVSDLAVNIRKSAPLVVEKGGYATFRIEVSNENIADALNPQIVTVIPDWLEVNTVRTSPECSVDNNRITCTGPSSLRQNQIWETALSLSIPDEFKPAECPAYFTVWTTATTQSIDSNVENNTAGSTIPTVCQIAIIQSSASNQISSGNASSGIPQPCPQNARCVQGARVFCPSGDVLTCPQTGCWSDIPEDLQDRCTGGNQSSTSGSNQGDVSLSLSRVWTHTAGGPNSQYIALNVRNQGLYPLYGVSLTLSNIAGLTLVSGHFSGYGECVPQGLDIVCTDVGTIQPGLQRELVLLFRTQNNQCPFRGTLVASAQFTSATGAASQADANMSNNSISVDVLINCGSQSSAASSALCPQGTVCSTEIECASSDVVGPVCGNGLRCCSPYKTSSQGSQQSTGSQGSTGSQNSSRRSDDECNVQPLTKECFCQMYPDFPFCDGGSTGRSSEGGNNSQGGGSSQGGGNSSQGGGNSSQGGGNSSQGGGNSSQASVVSSVSNSERNTSSQISSQACDPAHSCEMGYEYSCANTINSMFSRYLCAQSCLPSYTHSCVRMIPSLCDIFSPRNAPPEIRRCHPGQPVSCGGLNLTCPSVGCFIINRLQNGAINCRPGYFSSSSRSSVVMSSQSSSVQCGAGVLRCDPNQNNGRYRCVRGEIGYKNALSGMQNCGADRCSDCRTSQGESIEYSEARCGDTIQDPGEECDFTGVRCISGCGGGLGGGGDGPRINARCSASCRLITTAASADLLGGGSRQENKFLYILLPLFIFGTGIYALRAYKQVQDE